MWGAVFLVLVFSLGLDLFLVHLVLEVRQVLPVEEGVALDRCGRAEVVAALSAPFAAAFVVLGKLLILVR